MRRSLVRVLPYGATSRRARYNHSGAYMGSKPNLPKEWINRILAAGPRPADPLYVSNRTVGQKILLAGLIVLPCLPVAAMIFLLGNKPRTQGQTPAPVAISQPAAAAEPVKLPDSDLEVVEVHVEHGATSALKGTIRNQTDHAIRNAEVVFDLADDSGSQVGAVSHRFAALPAGSQTEFQFPVAQRDAAHALVREIHTP